MNSDYINGIDEILKSFGYEKNDKGFSEPKIDPSAGANNNECKNFCSDIPYGFQDIDPMLSNVVCEILSNVLSKKLPINVAASYGNWLQLIAQVIISFNAQQQYFQGGPGRYYNSVYRNVSNPFCQSFSSSNGGEHSDTGGGKKSKTKSSNKKIEELIREVKDLKMEIERLKSEINTLK